MILSAHEIALRLNTSSQNQCLVIRPYGQECQQPASYDLRAAENIAISRGATTLVPSMEWVELPLDLAGTLRCRSSLGRRGILLGGGFVDPGFRGNLTLCLVNMGNEDVLVKKNDRLVQMVLHEVRNGSTGYSGKYQDSSGVIGAR